MTRLIRSQRSRYPEEAHRKLGQVLRHFDGKSISTWEEQAGIFEIAYEAPENPVIIEIGSWIGNGTCLLAAGARGSNARIYAVDGFNGMTAEPNEAVFYQKFLRKVAQEERQRDVFDRNLAHFGLQSRVTAVAYPSGEARGQLPLEEGSVDVLFIDGGHTLDVVRQDIQLYLPLLKSGGTVAFHDFESGHAGVTTAVWEEVLRGTLPVYVRQRGSLLVLKKG